MSFDVRSYNKERKAFRCKMMLKFGYISSLFVCSEGFNSNLYFNVDKQSD